MDGGQARWSVCLYVMWSDDPTLRPSLPGLLDIGWTSVTFYYKLLVAYGTLVTVALREIVIIIYLHCNSIFRPQYVVWWEIRAQVPVRVDICIACPAVLSLAKGVT